MTTILELKNITAGYETVPVLKNVNLKVEEQDFIGIIGPNGGGKTTLLKVILGLLKPFSGEVEYYAPLQNLFGYLPQNSHFDQRFPIDVREVVLSGLLSEKGLFRTYGREDKKKAEEMHRKAGAAGYAPSASRFGAAWPDAARVLGLTAAEAREQSRTRRRAAAEGYASEQYNLGVMYQTGFGLPKDMAKAREWFQKAADQGDVQAKSILKKLR